MKKKTTSAWDSYTVVTQSRRGSHLFGWRSPLQPIKARPSPFLSSLTVAVVSQRTVIESWYLQNMYLESKQAA